MNFQPNAFRTAVFAALASFLLVASAEAASNLMVTGLGATTLSRLQVTKSRIYGTPFKGHKSSNRYRSKRSRRTYRDYHQLRYRNTQGRTYAAWTLDRKSLRD